MRSLLILAALLVPQWTVPQHVPAGLTNPCAGLPAFTVLYKSTTPTGGGGATVSTWSDSSGNGNTMTLSGLTHAIDTTNKPPNGQQTVQLQSAEGAITVLSASGSMTVYAVYRLNDNSTKHALTSNASSNGAFAYYPTAASAGAQGADSSNVAAIGQATDATNTTDWTTTIVSWVGPSTTLNFYRWDSSHSGVDTTATFPGSSASPGINQLFANIGPAEQFDGNIIEIGIIAGTAINSTQAGALHSCAAHTYGVP